MDSDEEDDSVQVRQIGCSMSSPFERPQVIQPRLDHKSSLWTV